MNTKKLSPEEQRLEDALSRAQITPPVASATQLDEAARGLAQLNQTLRGGARPGAGRPKAKEAVKTNLNLSKEAREKLDAISRAGKLSKTEAAELAILAYPMR